MIGFNNYFRHSPLERRLFFAAMLWLGLSRLAIMVLPFRWIAPRLGRNTAITTEEPPSECRPAVIDSIQWAVRTASRYAPWECKCLVQAMAGKILLRRWDIPSTIYLGVRRDDNSDFAAHAWLMCEGIVLTGEPGMEQFTVVATFADK